MSKNIFVTATGTDIGKTYVSALIVKKMRELHYNCGYYKPVLSGAEIRDGNLYAGDCEYVKKIAGLGGSALDFASYVFKPALSPHLASQIENNPIKLDKIKTDFLTKSKLFDYTVVEGAGGIVCPMDLSSEEPFLIKDIIKGLGLDVIIISSAELGSINSAVLTVEYAKIHGIKVKGIILNNYDANNEMQSDNKLQIERLTGVPVIACVKKGDNELDIDEEILINIFKENINR